MGLSVIGYTIDMPHRVPTLARRKHAQALNLRSDLPNALGRHLQLDPAKGALCHGEEEGSARTGEPPDQG